MRTRWLETPRRSEPGRDRTLIEPKHPDRHTFAQARAATWAQTHSRSKASRSRPISLLESFAADSRAITTTSRISDSRRGDCRNHSRIPLFTRFRDTAFPTRRLTVTPRRLCPSDRLSAGVATNRTKFWDAKRFPARPTRWKSRDRRIRSAREKRPALPATGYFEGVVAANRFRPLARRRFKTARPPRELMRARNPWPLRRRIRLG